MIADLRTMLWKELKEVPQQTGGRRGGPMNLLVVVGLIGVVMPLRAGVNFPTVGQQAMLVVLPMVLIASIIADSFAGERERHTLETLLASPIADRAILFGKIGAAVAFGWGTAILSLLLGLVTMNFKFGQGKPLLFSAPTGIGVALLSLLTSLLVATAGVLVSLRASTVRQAQTMLSMGLVVLVFAGIFGAGLLPHEWLAWLHQITATTGEMTLILVGAGVLLVIDIVVLGAAMLCFRRSRLILD